MSRPPSQGPTMLAMPKTAPKAPWIRPRSRGGIKRPITVTATAKSAPPPSPWSPRKRTSASMLGARPESAEPKRKINTAQKSRVRLFTRSASRPKMGTATVEASR